MSSKQFVFENSNGDRFEITNGQNLTLDEIDRLTRQFSRQCKVSHARPAPRPKWQTPTAYALSLAPQPQKQNKTAQARSAVRRFKRDGGYTYVYITNAKDKRGKHHVNMNCCGAGTRLQLTKAEAQGREPCTRCWPDFEP